MNDKNICNPSLGPTTKRSYLISFFYTCCVCGDFGPPSLNVGLFSGKDVEQDVHTMCGHVG